MKPINITLESIDALLPQTQCGDCTYAGCLPYAHAILKNAAPLNLCLPGGVKVLKKLGQLLNKDVNNFIEDMELKAKPKRLAIIREPECIGCTKCIQACPVDAIFGASKQMHTVIVAECTGCGLCVEPCPMDCIDMVVTADQQYQSDYARQRFQHRNARLEKQKQEAVDLFQENILAEEMDLETKHIAKKAAIAAALARVQNKK